MDFRVSLDPQVRVRSAVEQGLDEIQHAIGARAWNGSRLLISVFHRQIKRCPAFGVGKIDVRPVVHEVKRHSVVTVLHSD